MWKREASAEVLNTLWPSVNANQPVGTGERPVYNHFA